MKLKTGCEFGIAWQSKQESPDTKDSKDFSFNNVQVEKGSVVKTQCVSLSRMADGRIGEPVYGDIKPKFDVNSTLTEMQVDESIPDSHFQGDCISNKNTNQYLFSRSQSEDSPSSSNLNTSPCMCKSSTPERGLMNIPLSTPQTDACSKSLSPIAPQDRRQLESNSAPLLAKSKVCMNLSKFFSSSSFPVGGHKCNRKVSAEDSRSDEVSFDADQFYDCNSNLSQEERSLLHIKAGSFLKKSLSALSCERHVQSSEVNALPSQHQTSNDCVHAYCPVVGSSSFTTIGSDGPICRICHEGDQGEEHLFTPCRCSGTLGYAHQKCLERWLQTKNQDVCELCEYQFQTKRKSRPFKEWLQQPTHRHDRRNVMMDILCFCMLTPMVVSSAWLCLHGARYYLTYFENRELEGIGLIILATVLLAIYLFWGAVSFRYHCNIWNVWREEHQLVHIVVDKPVCVPDKQNPSTPPLSITYDVNKNIISHDDKMGGTFV